MTADNDDEDDDDDNGNGDDDKNSGLSSCWSSPDGNSGGQDHSATPTNIFHNNSHNILHISIHPNIYQMANLMIIVIILILS